MSEIISTGVLFVLLLAVMAVLGALPVMFLWNGLMPDIFGLPTIGFMQALGLNLLAAILFKSDSSSKQ